jgi:hypothetical protein
MICGHEPERPSAEIRSSSAFLSTSEEAAEHVAADGLVEFVEDRPGREQVFCRSEGSLHHPQHFRATHPPNADFMRVSEPSSRTKC